MKQSGHLNPSEETGTGFPITSKCGRTPPNKHGGVGRQQHNNTAYADDLVIYGNHLGVSDLYIQMSTALKKIENKQHH